MVDCLFRAYVSGFGIVILVIFEATSSFPISIQYSDLRYVWIGALTIIKYDKEDWKTEADTPDESVHNVLACPLVQGRHQGRSSLYARARYTQGDVGITVRMSCHWQNGTGLSKSTCCRDVYPLIMLSTS